MKFTTMTAAIAITIATQIPTAEAAIVNGSFNAVVGGDSSTTIQLTAGATTPDTGYVDGNYIPVNFSFNNVTNTFNAFQIGSYVLTFPAFTQSITEDPANQTLTFSAEPTANETLTLTLAALSVFTSPIYGNAITLPDLAQVDLTNSIASVVIDNTNGSQTVLEAVLVPEPASMAVLLASVAGLAWVRRARARV